MIVQVRLLVGGSRLSVAKPTPESAWAAVRDPSITYPVGRVTSAEWDGHYLVVTLDLDEAALRSRLRERRGAF